MLKVATREGLCSVFFSILIPLTASGNTDHTSEYSARSGNDTEKPPYRISDAAAAAAATVAALSSSSLAGNCTRCAVWRGDNCTTYKPCVFCNASVECVEPLVCRDDICAELPPDSKRDLNF